MDQDKNIMIEHEQDQKELEEKQVAVEDKKAKVEAKKEEQENQKASLESLEVKLDKKNKEKESIMAALKEDFEELENYEFTLDEEKEILQQQEEAILKAKELAESEKAEIEEAERQAKLEAERQAAAAREKEKEQASKASSSSNASTSKKQSSNTQSSASSGNPAPPLQSGGNGVLNWPTASKNVSSGYGPRWGTEHKGIDIAAGKGTAVHAAQSGVVSRVVTGCVEGDRSCGGGFGNHIMIVHQLNGKTYTTIYAHLSSVNVSNGQSVSSGQHIGGIGNTGDSYGAHLHFEVHPGGYGGRGTAANPMGYLP